MYSTTPLHTEMPCIAQLHEMSTEFGEIDNITVEYKYSGVLYNLC